MNCGLPGALQAGSLSQSSLQENLVTAVAAGGAGDAGSALEEPRCDLTSTSSPQRQAAPKVDIVLETSTAFCSACVTKSICCRMSSSVWYGLFSEGVSEGI